MFVDRQFCFSCYISLKLYSQSGKSVGFRAANIVKIEKTTIFFLKKVLAKYDFSLFPVTSPLIPSHHAIKPLRVFTYPAQHEDGDSRGHQRRRRRLERKFINHRVSLKPNST